MTCSTSYCLVTLKDLWNVYIYMYVCKDTSTQIEWVVSVSVWYHNMILNHSQTCVACGDSIGFIVKSAIFLFGIHKNAAHLLYNMKWDSRKYNWNCTFLCDVYKMSFSMLSYFEGDLCIWHGQRSLSCVVHKTLFMELGGCWGRIVCVMEGIRIWSSEDLVTGDSFYRMPDHSGITRGGSKPPEIPKFWQNRTEFPVLWKIHP
jgi:hypothetical protein